MKNYYGILNIESQASIDQIRKAYRVQAIKYHPDKTFNDPELTVKFIEVKEAYEILSDFMKRAEYDLYWTNVFKSKSASKNQTQANSAEKFQYEPFRPFITKFDRETQATPQFEPLTDPWGKSYTESLDFFCLPKNIGQLIGGATTLHKGAKKISQREYRMYIIKESYITIPLILLVTLFTLITGDPGLSLVSLICIGIIWAKYRGRSNVMYFEHYCYYIGVNGFASFNCVDSRDNITLKTEVNFNQITDLITKSEVRTHYSTYFDTRYTFLWINATINAVVHTGIGTYRDEKNNPAKNDYPGYWINKEAEKYWTIYLMDSMEDKIDKTGYIVFNIYSYELNRFAPYIRVGPGFISFISKEEEVTFNFDKIKRIYIKGSDLYIDHLDYRKEFFFFKSGQQKSIPLDHLSNRQFFFKSLEILLGYKIESDSH